MKATLKDKSWGEFYIKDIFNSIQRGKRLKKGDHIAGSIPYVSSTSNNNGIDGFLGNLKGVRMFNNCCTIANSGSVGACFYHPLTFVASDHVTQLKNEKFNRYIYLFISTVASRLSEKYSFNREMNDNRIRREVIMLPVNDHREPDYDFMEQYMRDLEKQKIASYKELVSNRIAKLSSQANIVTLNDKKWGEFCLKDLFDFQKGNQTNMTILNSGNTPLVSARKIDNGYKDFIKTSKGLFQKNNLSLNNDGDGGAGISYYQPYEAALDSHVTALLPKFSVSKHALLFISRSITSQRGKFGHGYSLTNNRLSAFKLMLPVNSKGSPDYEYMEQYMKQIEGKQLAKYLNYLETK